MLATDSFGFRSLPAKAEIAGSAKWPHKPACATDVGRRWKNDPAFEIHCISPRERTFFKAPGEREWAKILSLFKEPQFTSS